jgi:galactosylceramidase
MKDHFLKEGRGATRKCALACCSILSLLLPVLADQTVEVKGDAGGKRFDGIGAVSGGGGTSVLLKDYPEPQRSQVLDMLFKPKFGASMSALLVEVPGDGSTLRTEPSHSHFRGDENFFRGYEWWLMSEAKKRNPAIPLDAVAWGCPGWVGTNHFWSQDMCDYYVKWIEGLKSAHGLDLDAIGCRNESGVNEDFIKKFRATLNSNGLSAVKLHGFDNWQRTKFDWVRDMATDPVLKAAVDVVGNHTMADNPTPADVKIMLDDMGKPIWNTEEHVYKEGFDCEISLVQAFNKNFIESGVTKIVNWYLAASMYQMDAYTETPPAMIAREPWSGNYSAREVLWGYAHYGQFSEIGWQYLNGACGNLAGGGTFVTLKSPGADYSIIAESKGARAAQKVTFNTSGGLSRGKLCVWRSNEREQFVKMDDITPVIFESLRGATFTITLDPNSIYSISTTTGQQKGSFDNVPASKPFPFPYYDEFEGYQSAKAWGYLPHYLTDISGVFELADRPDKTGHCLRQVLTEKAISFANEWMPYTILGDKNWKDYEVSVDVFLDNGGWAGVMGRVSSAFSGDVCNPKGYYLRLEADGTCALFAATQTRSAAAGTQLATGKANQATGSQWHNVKLRFSGTTITGFVDGAQVLSVSNDLCAGGLAGLVTGGEHNARNTALFDNLIVNTVGGPKPPPTVFAQDQYPIYKP